MSSNPYFTRELFKFLSELRAHNNREWFLRNKERYEQQVRHPLLRFIADLGPGLRKINPHIVADPSPVRGSMMKIYRDIRFSKDKRRLALAMPPGSRIVVYGALADEPLQIDSKDFFFRDKKLEGFWLSRWIKRKGFLQRLILAYQIQKLLSNELQTRVQGRFPLEDILSAIDLYEKQRTEGKVLLVPLAGLIRPISEWQNANLLGMALPETVTIACLSGLRENQQIQ